MDPFWQYARPYTPSRRIRNPILDVPDSAIALVSGGRPTWLRLGFNTLNPGQQLEVRKISGGYPFYALAILGISSAGASGAGGFTFTIYTSEPPDVPGDAPTNVQWSDRFESQSNGTGTAQRPCWLKRPYYIAPYTPILARVQNLSNTTSNTGMLVLFGLRAVPPNLRPPIVLNSKMAARGVSKPVGASA